MDERSSIVVIGRLERAPWRRISRELSRRRLTVQRHLSKTVRWAVVGHGAVRSLRSGRLHDLLGQAERQHVRVLSELAFLRELDLAPHSHVLPGTLTCWDLMRRTGLSESTVQLLTVFDLFDSSDGGYSLRDLRAAERFSRWLEGRDPVEAINAALSARRPLRAPAHLSELELTDREAEADQLPLGDDPMTFDEAWESGVMAWSSASVHDALKSFVKCSQMRPKDAGCLVNLAMALERVGEREQAKQVLRRATIVDPGRPEPWLDLAALSSGTERINHLKKALETDPDDQITEYELAEEFTASERYHEALPLWERLIAAVDTLQPSQRTRARKSLTLCKLALAADLDQTI